MLAAITIVWAIWVVTASRTRWPPPMLNPRRIPEPRPGPPGALQPPRSWVPQWGVSLPRRHVLLVGTPHSSASSIFLS